MNQNKENIRLDTMSFPSFSRITDEMFRLLEQAMRSVVIDSKKTLYEQGAEADRIWLLVRGSVFLRERKGRAERISAGFLVGSWFGLAETLSGGRYCDTLIAEAGSRFYRLNLSGLNWLQTKPDISAFFARLVAEEYFQYRQQPDSGDSIAAVASLLLEKLQQYGKISNNVIRITQSQLALELGIRRETVNRRLKEFEKKGIICVKRGGVELLKPDRLQLDT